MASPVLVARYASRNDLAPIVRAALDEDIVYIALPSAPPAGRHVLQLWVGPGLMGAVSAELVGSGRGGEYPLRLRPIDRAHVPELEALLVRRSAMPAASRSNAPPEPSPPPPVAAPSGAPRRISSQRMLAARATPTQVSPAIPPVQPKEPEPKPAEIEIPDSAPQIGTVVFSPDAVMRHGSNASADDEQTIPRSMPSKRPAVDLDMAVSEDMNTLPRSEPRPLVAPAVSWNVRIAPTTKDPLCGRTIAGDKYVLESVIGTGAMGIVFKGTHRELGRTVAIKVLNPRWRDDPDSLAVFKTEARAASLLEHANVARLYDYGQEEDGLVYIVMEYLSGYTLGSVLDARKRLTIPRAVDIVMQVCSALAAAHEHGIVHRDVKPDNIVLVPAQDDEGQPTEIVKVCDFGIAALGTARDPNDDRTGGTPEYMAPEQARGANVTPAADVYAAGVVLYEMVTGEVPFKADAPYRVLIKHANEPPRPPSELVPGLAPAIEAVILRALEKAPERRFQSARDMRAELRKAL
jgi:serine/threonine protein kinase